MGLKFGSLLVRYLTVTYYCMELFANFRNFAGQKPLYGIGWSEIGCLQLNANSYLVCFRKNSPCQYELVIAFVIKAKARIRYDDVTFNCTASYVMSSLKESSSTLTVIVN